MAPRRADARIPKHTPIQAVTNPSEVATCSGTPNSRIVTRPEVSGGALRASRSVQESREWARSARERDADSIARLAEVGGPTWISTRLYAQELDTGASVDSTTPVLPEERRVPNDKRMEQDAHAGSGLRVSLPCHWHCSRRGQGRQLRMLAAYTTRRLPSVSLRCSCGISFWSAGHRSVPSSWRAKSWPEKRPAFRGG